MHNSNSEEQRQVERKVLEKIGLQPARLKINGVSFNFDGYSEEDKKIVEIYAGIKEIKSGQKQKISQDILKMLLYEEIVGSEFGKHFIVIDKTIHQQLQFDNSKTWQNMAFNKFNIKVEYIEIDKKDYESLVRAKERQGRKFR